MDTLTLHNAHKNETATGAKAKNILCKLSLCGLVGWKCVILCVTSKNISNVCMPASQSGLSASQRVYLECSMDRFQVTSSFCRIQNYKATKSFVFIRHKRRYIYFCLQFFSSLVCLAWKPTHFESQIHGGLWHRVTIAFIEKILYTYLVIYDVFRG